MFPELKGCEIDTLGLYRHDHTVSREISVKIRTGCPEITLGSSNLCNDYRISTNAHYIIYVMNEFSIYLHQPPRLVLLSTCVFRRVLIHLMFKLPTANKLLQCPNHVALIKYSKAVHHNSFTWRCQARRVAHPRSKCANEPSSSSSGAIVFSARIPGSQAFACCGLHNYGHICTN